MMVKVQESQRGDDMTMRMIYYIDGLVQERRNSIANALELCLSCTNPSICDKSHNR